MNFKIPFLSLVIISLCIIIPVNAVEISENNYPLILLSETNNQDSLVPFAAPIYGIVTQGEVVRNGYVVPTDKTTLELRLSWNNPNNNLQLRLIDPNNSVSPIFDDASDNINDSTISLILTGQILRGNWVVEIIGDYVIGYEEYELRFNVI